MRFRLPLFFPLAFVLIAGMVWTALQPGVERRLEWRASLERAASDGFVVEGDRLELLSGTDRASVAFGDSGGGRYAVITSVGTVAEAAADGVHYFLPADAVRAIGAPEVDVAFEVRAPARDGAEMWLARCVMSNVSDTRWVQFPSTQEWSTHVLRCPVDPATTEHVLDLMIWSDAQGDGGRVDLRRIQIRPPRGDGGGGAG